MVMQGFRNIIKNRDGYKAPYPMLILVGEYDIELALRISKKWHEESECAEFQIIENAGHCANLDQPEEFNRIVTRFFMG